jgi:hypothetical protein
VHDGKDFDPLLGPAMDHPTGTLEHLAPLGANAFRHRPPRFGEVRKLRPAGEHALHHALGMELGGLGDVVANGREVGHGRPGPDDRQATGRL